MARQGSAKPSSAVRFRPAPPNTIDVPGDSNYAGDGSPIGLPFQKRFLLSIEVKARVCIKVKSPVQMIDLMLQNPGIPSLCFRCARLSLLVQVIHAYGAGPWNDRRKSVEAETAFVERHFVVSR